MIDGLLSPVSVLSWSVLGLVLVGTLLGVMAGAIPGLTGAMVIALTVPVTYGMDKVEALVLLVSMYVGAVGGGLITATLLRMPGTPASIMTTLDGYPMAERGESRRALALGIGASFVGGLVSWILLVLIAGPAAAASVKLGPWEMFSLILVALVLIASISRGQMLVGLFAGALGALLAMPGPNPATGVARMTFGLPAMADGFKVLPVLIGLFALAQVIREASRSVESETATASKTAGELPGLTTWIRQWINLLRSSFLGTVIGILPGVGANVGSVVAYSAAKAGATPEEETRFGKGADSGIVASEAANNATVGGALVPLVSLGIPGSVVDAVLLGAFVIHGVQPGRMLFTNHPEVVHAITGSYLLANFAMVVVMAAGVRWIAKLATVPKWLLLPSILTFCVLGTYALANRAFDVWVMIGFGILGFVLERYRIPLAPLVIGFVLAPVAEENLLSGLAASGGNLTPLFTRPISLVLVLIALALLLWPHLRKARP